MLHVLFHVKSSKISNYGGRSAPENPAAKYNGPRLGANLLFGLPAPGLPPTEVLLQPGVPLQSRDTDKVNTVEDKKG